MATKRPARKTTKPEVDAEMEDIKSEIENRPVVPAAQKLSDDARAARVLKVAADSSVEKIVNAATQLSLSLQGSMNDVAAEMKAKLEELHDLDEAIEWKKKELEELGKKDVVSTSLDLLVLEHNKKSLELGEAIKAQRELLAKEREEAEEAREKEEAEYGYNLAQSRRNNDVARQQSLQDQERANKLKQEDLERGWTLKAQELAKREADLAALNLRLANLDKEVEAKVAAAVKTATDSLNASKHFEVSHLKKDAESAALLANQTISSLRTDVSAKDAIIRDLQNKLDLATTKVQSIAEKALESQSGRASMEAVQTFAATQQPSNSKKA